MSYETENPEQDATLRLLKDIETISHNMPQIVERLDPDALLDFLLSSARRGALEEVAKACDRRVQVIIDEEGSWEPDTNVTNLPEWAQTACEELEAIASIVRALAASQPAPNPIGGEIPANPAIKPEGAA